MLLDRDVAAKLLSDTCDVLEKHAGKKGYWVDSGTLLGFVRDNDINQYDHDIDVRILPNKVPETDEATKAILDDLWDIGYRLFAPNVGRRAELISIWRSEDWVHRIMLDLKFAHTDGNLVWVYCWPNPACLEPPRVHAYPARFFREIGEVEYRGRKYPCPTPVEEYLVHHYGPDWRQFKARADEAEMTDLKWDYMKSPPCAMDVDALLALRKQLKVT